MQGKGSVWTIRRVMQWMEGETLEEPSSKRDSKQPQPLTEIQLELRTKSDLEGRSIVVLGDQSGLSKAATP